MVLRRQTCITGIGVIGCLWASIALLSRLRCICLQIGNFVVLWSWMFSFCNLYLSTLYSWKKVGFLVYLTLLFGMSFKCSIICTLDVRIKHGDFPYVQSYGCFLFIVGGHLLTSCMALQTFRSMSITIYMNQLAFMRCPPSILKKISCGHLFKIFTTHFFVRKKIMVLLWFPFYKNLCLVEGLREPLILGGWRRSRPACRCCGSKCLCSRTDYSTCSYFGSTGSCHE